MYQTAWRAISIAERFTKLCEAIGADPLALALGGGEDYVLLFTLPEGIEPPEKGARRIGKIIKGNKVVLLREGSRSPLPDLGWDHLAAS
jgi:thiamine-monophosphate kinase